jgi:hypothetical protein
MSSTGLSRAAVVVVLVGSLFAPTCLGNVRASVHFAVSDDGGQTPADEQRRSFDCSEKVFAVVEADALRAGPHRVQVLWYNPRGRKQEHTDFEVQALGGHNRFWAWLSLHRPAGGMLDRVLLNDRASGMEDFLGRWEARVYVDGDLLDNGTFEVYC